MPEAARIPRTGSSPHRYSLTIFWEDTDAAGIVYYANYLKFLERARSDMVAAHGIDQRRLLEKDGIVFPVRRCLIDYLRPARLGDRLEVRTAVRRAGAAMLDLDQDITCEGEAVARAQVRLACVGRDGRPRRMPPAVRNRFDALVVAS